MTAGQLEHDRLSRQDQQHRGPLAEPDVRSSRRRCSWLSLALLDQQHVRCHAREQPPWSDGEGLLADESRVPLPRSARTAAWPVEPSIACRRNQGGTCTKHKHQYVYMNCRTAHKHSKTSSVTWWTLTEVSSQALTTSFTVCIRMIFPSSPAGSFRMRFCQSEMRYRSTLPETKINVRNGLYSRTSVWDRTVDPISSRSNVIQIKSLRLLDR